MASNKSALIKVSGDVVDKEEFYKNLAVIARKYELYIVCGGGSAITANLKENKISFRFVNGERVILSQRGKDLAYKVLSAKSSFLKSQLWQKNIKATVSSSVIMFGKKICHVNGDSFVRMVYRNFSKTFVFTLEGRDKSPLLKGIKNLKIVYL